LAVEVGLIGTFLLNINHHGRGRGREVHPGFSSPAFGLTVGGSITTTGKHSESLLKSSQDLRDPIWETTCSPETVTAKSFFAAPPH
jgi:hypothetical protein